MTNFEQIESQIRTAVTSGDDDMLKLITSQLIMAVDAKSVLRKKGYGWTGLDLLETAKLVPDNDE